MFVVEGALRILDEMATFKGAGVSEKEPPASSGTASGGS
jgi:hypothetical protein